MFEFKILHIPTNKCNHFVICTTFFNSLFSVLVYFIISSILVFCEAASYSNNKTLSDIKLIENASSWFEEPVSGFEEFVRKYNESEKATFFTSVHMPDHIIRHNGTIGDAQDFIILPGQTNVSRVPYKNVVMFTVFRSIPEASNRYSAHLAYVRKFGGEPSVEWDYYAFHYHNLNGSFITAFFPIRRGPEVVTIGLGFSITRSKKREAQKIEALKTQLITRPVLPTPEYVSSLNLHWSWKSTELPRLLSTTPRKNSIANEDATTEYPYYGETFVDEEGKDVEVNSGFTPPPPWSEFRFKESTTETPEGRAYGDEASSGIQKPKKLCFGLQRNCDGKSSPKPRVKKGCVFGLRCHQSFVDRYAVKKTTTEPPTEEETSAETESTTESRKKKYKSLKECEAANSKHIKGKRNRGRSFSRRLPTKGRTMFLNLGGKNKSVINSTTDGFKGAFDLRKSQIASELEKIKGSSAIVHQPLENLTSQRNATTSRRKREVDTCAEYRDAESLMNIEEGESSSSTTKPIIEKLKTEATISITQDVKEAANPFTNSLNASASAISEDLAPWEVFTDSSNALTSSLLEQPTSLIIDTVVDSATNILDSIPGVSNDQETTETTETPKDQVRRRHVEYYEHRIRKKETDKLGLDTSKEASDPDFESSTTQPSKTDSDPKDIKKLESPYIGIGDCEYLPIKIKDILPRDVEELVDLFLKILRVQCVQNFRNQALQLFSSKLLQKNKDGSISMNESHYIFHKMTLSETEWTDFSSAVVFHQFYNIYLEQSKRFEENKADNKSPDGSKISGTVKTLTLLIFQILNLIHSSEKTHAIKFSNSLLVMLQAQRTELQTETDDLEKCDLCLIEKDVTFNSHIQLYTLMRFIVDKLPEIVASSHNKIKIEEMFNKFYLTNLSTITELVKNKSPFVY